MDAAKHRLRLQSLREQLLAHEGEITLGDFVAGEPEETGEGGPASASRRWSKAKTAAHTSRGAPDE